MSDPYDPTKKIKGFLRKETGTINAEDIEKKKDVSQNKEFIRKKLLEDPAAGFNQSFFSFEAIKNRFVFLKDHWKRRKKTGSRFVRESLPVLGFVTFSCWILWRMETQLDSMRRKVLTTKTLKEAEIEKENEEIAAALQGKPLKFIPIKDYVPKNKYKFEDDDEEEQGGEMSEGEAIFSTKGDTLLSTKTDFTLENQLKAEIEKIKANDEKKNKKNNREDRKNSRYFKENI